MSLRDKGITIYRDNAREIVEARWKPLYGLLRVPPKPKPPKPHQCRPPNVFVRLLQLFYAPVRRGDLWRCECGQVFQLAEGLNARIGLASKNGSRLAAPLKRRGTPPTRKARSRDLTVAAARPAPRAPALPGVRAEPRRRVRVRPAVAAPQDEEARLMVPHAEPPAAIEDTLIAHHAFASHLPKSLAHVTSVYCDARPWKILAGKDAGKEKGLAPWEKLERGDEDAVKNLLDYNAADAKLTILDWHRMQPDLADERHTYDSDKAIAQMCRRMTETGIGFDIAGREELSKHLRSRKRGLLAAMRDMVGKKSFHPARQNDVRSALFGRFKAPLLRPTPTGLASTNNETLEWLSSLGGRAGELADMTLRWRSADKTLGSYVDNVFFIERPGSNIGRVHPPWKLGPVTGRLSCWVMTLPRYGDDWETQVRRLYLADPKRKTCRLVAQIHDAAIFEVEGRFVYYDLSQAELRCAAHFSGDEALIEACRVDVHTENAKVVFDGIPETMKRLARANEPSTFLDDNGKVQKWKAVTAKKGGCKDERDIAKNCSFCVTYEGTAERAFITLHQAGNKKVTMRACEELVRRFHSRYKTYYRYIDTNEAYCREHGYLRSVLANRIRWLGQFAPRTEIANFPIQSGIADVHNERLPRIEARCRNLRRVDDVKKVIAEVWQEPIYVPHNGRSFVMPIDLKDGERWSSFG